jgi:hypothetical protein
MSWSRQFDDPIQPLKGKPLVPLKDERRRGVHHGAADVETAEPGMAGGGEVLLLAAEDRGR